VSEAPFYFALVLYSRLIQLWIQCKERDICVDDYRIRAVVAGKSLDAEPTSTFSGIPIPSLGTTRAYFENGWEDVPGKFDIRVYVSIFQ